MFVEIQKPEAVLKALQTVEGHLKLRWKKLPQELLTLRRQIRELLAAPPAEVQPVPANPLARLEAMPEIAALVGKKRRTDHPGADVRKRRMDLRLRPLKGEYLLRKVTQRMLAERAGVSRELVNYIEGGKYDFSPRDKNLQAIRTALAEFENDHNKMKAEDEARVHAQDNE